MKTYRKIRASRYFPPEARTYKHDVPNVMVKVWERTDEERTRYYARAYSGSSTREDFGVQCESAKVRADYIHRYLDEKRGYATSSQAEMPTPGKRGRPMTAKGIMIANAVRQLMAEGRAERDVRAEIQWRFGLTYPNAYAYVRRAAVDATSEEAHDDCGVWQALEAA
jgi:hypothetical protein